MLKSVTRWFTVYVIHYIEFSNLETHTHAQFTQGPYPASSSSLHTSVGTTSISRFARPVCFQDLPESALPVELRDANERGIWRHVNGDFHNNPIEKGSYAKR